MSYPLRSFPGAALAGTLQTAITNASTTFASSTSLSSWSDITGNNWAGYVCVAMEYGTANEEKILCTYNSATQTFTIVNRNYDGTTKVNHAAGSLFVPVFTATEAGELNSITQSLSGMLGKTGTSTTPGDIHLNSSSDGASKFPAYADHYHSLTDSTLNTWLGSTANATLPSTVHVPTTNLDAGSLPSGVTVPATQVTTGAFPSGVTLPAGQITSGSLSSSVAVPLASLVAGSLPASISTSNIFTLSGTTVSPAVTGYNSYIVLVTVYTKATTSGTYPNVSLRRSASSTMSSPTTMLTVQEYFPDATNFYTMSGFVLYEPGDTSTFYLQLQTSGATSPTASAIVIGIN